MKRRWTAAAGTALCVLAACSGESGTPDGDRLARRSSVVALARLEPRGGVLRVSAGDGDRIARLAVAEGEWVDVDQVLAFTSSYPERIAAHEYLKTRLAEAVAQRSAETTYHEAAIEQARLDAERAGTANYPFEALGAEVGVKSAALSAARSDVEALEQLVAKKLSAAKELEDAQLLVQGRHAELERAKSERDKAKSEASIAEREAANRVELAQAQLVRAQRSIPVESLRSEIGLSEARLEASVVRAPEAAQVLKVLVSPGESVRNRPLMHLGDTRQMYAVAEVYETDIALVEVGQRATITSQALPKELEGVVESVGSLIFKTAIFGDDPSAATDGRVFEVRIRLEENEVAGRFTNHEVQARIDLGTP